MDKRETILFWFCLGLLCLFALSCSWIPWPVDPCKGKTCPGPSTCVKGVCVCPDGEPADLDSGHPCGPPPPPPPPQPQCELSEEGEPLGCDCYYGEVFIKCAPPPPPPCKPEPRAGVYWLWKTDRAWTADATPKLCAACYCKQYNHCMVPNRQCCPLGCEGDPDRFEREKELIGGDAPVWHLKVDSGDLRLVPDPWKGVVVGRGTGLIWWCFPNGKKCSGKLAIDR